MERYTPFNTNEQDILEERNTLLKTHSLLINVYHYTTCANNGWSDTIWSPEESQPAKTVRSWFNYMASTSDAYNKKYEQT